MQPWTRTQSEGVDGLPATAPAGCGEFCAAEYRRLVGALSLYCGSLDVAEDCAQEALARACLNWRRVQGYASPHAWTLRVAMNLANSWFRRANIERRVLGRLADSSPAGGIDVIDGLVVRQAVAALPRRQRAAIVLTYYIGLSSEEAGYAMGCKAATVRVHAHRALETLRTKLAMEEELYADGHA